MEVFDLVEFIKCMIKVYVQLIGSNLTFLL